MNVDVVVVGGGPSGLMTAAELAAAGVDVVVLERRSEPVGSRAGTILPRVLELFDTRDLAQTFIDRARAIRDNPLVPFHIWAGLQPLDWGHLESRFGYRLILPQNITEELLAEHASAQGARIVRGAAVETIEQFDAGVAVRARLTDGTEQTYSARYVVGADGARSIVRRAAGIEFDGHDATFTGMVADVVLDFPWDAPRANGHNEHGWAAAFPFDETGHITRFNIVHEQRRHADKSEPVTVAEVHQCVREIFGESLDFTELRWGSRYTDETRTASRFRDRRIVLVGESTRVHYPASGVGMNFCLQDAFNLGWKLAAVINGVAEESLLDTYEAERRPVTEALLESVAAQCAMQFDFSPEGLAYRRFFEQRLFPLPEVGRTLVRDLNGLSFPYPREATDHPFVGERAPDLVLQTREGLVRTGELLRGHEFVLIDCTGENHYDELKFGRTPVRVVSGVMAPAPAGLHDVRSLLLRPDSYVAWADTATPTPERAVAQIERWLKVER
ncbi:FAD-dependent oxidoreductase [Nocardia sp. NPDC055002]